MWSVQYVIRENKNAHRVLNSNMILRIGNIWLLFNQKKNIWLLKANCPFLLMRGRHNSNSKKFFFWYIKEINYCTYDFLYSKDMSLKWNLIPGDVYWNS